MRQNGVNKELVAPRRSYRQLTDKCFVADFQTIVR